ncbi:transposase [Amphibacillus sp. Q70]|uniref:transposase n=1 Tax=Amphibacillus sp. Q70 TaxID=3453416 RepID=UPI003F8801DA
MFTYIDKKRKTVMTEMFIQYLVCYVPDKQFKMIRHYSIYTHRSRPTFLLSSF